MKNLYLIGMMGTSKTSVGKLVADLLGFRFYDSDIYYEITYNTTINNTFQNEGESVFREREHEVLKTLTSKQNVVLSLGGGVVLYEKNHELLKNNSVVIELVASVDEIYNRVKHNKRRPLLKEMTKEKIAQIYHERKELYSSLSSMSIQAENNTLSERANEIVNAYRLFE